MDCFGPRGPDKGTAPLAEDVKQTAEKRISGQERKITNYKRKRKIIENKYFTP